MKKILFFIFLFAASSVHAATITVTNLSDSGAGSLRAAITTANGDATADTIEFGALSGTIALSSALPDITTAMTISGNGSVIIAGSGAASSYRIVDINIAGGGARTDVTLQNLTFQEGDAFSASQNGGAVLAEGNVNLLISNCTFSGNLAVSGGALAAVNTAQVVVSGGIFQGNIAGSPSIAGNGGAIFIGDAQVEIRKVRFVSNRAFTRGGAIAISSVAGDSTVTVMTSLFLQNDSANGGGAILVAEGGNAATIDLQRVSIIGNDGNRGGSMTSGAGGIYTSGSPTVHLRNSLLAINGKNRSGTIPDSFTGGFDNCEGSITSQGQNLSDIADTQCGFGSSDFSSATAGLGYTTTSTTITLASNSLLSSSQAIDAGNSTFCATSSILNTDIDSKASYGACDIGAFEFGSCGDNFVQIGASEQCELPSTSTCSATCQNISATGGTSGSGGSSGTGGDAGSGGGSAGTGGSVAASSGCSLLLN